jgi:hypothetical protein
MNYYNTEGYASPTEHEALTRIRREELKEQRKKKYRPLVYICSPFAGENIVQNIENARKYCKYATENGCIPIAPHLYFPQFMNDNNPDERDLAFKMNGILMSKCDELWVFGRTYSLGMQKEMKLAKRKRMFIKFIEEV